jgi:hypothetical protein
LMKCVGELRRLRRLGAQRVDKIAARLHGRRRPRQSRPRARTVTARGADPYSRTSA